MEYNYGRLDKTGGGNDESMFGKPSSGRLAVGGSLVYMRIIYWLPLKLAYG